MTRRDVVLIGGSAGALQALTTIVPVAFAKTGDELHPDGISVAPGTR